jgi:putative ABC transport system ATP-binding protein
MSAIISAKNLTKSYGKGGDIFRALGPVDLEIEEGTFTVIVGKSGSGKSTLLNLMAGLDAVSGGSLKVQGKDLEKTSSKQLALFRKQIGIIFQFYNLLPNLNTLENVMISSMLKDGKGSKKEAVELLERFNLGHRISTNIKVLSGGEKQRVAICRALVSEPKILFCDEPTGALDTANEILVRDILVDLHKKGMTIVMVTHNTDFAHLADTVIEMKDGIIISK